MNVKRQLRAVTGLIGSVALALLTACQDQPITPSPAADGPVRT
jgi:hypothetical protein